MLFRSLRIYSWSDFQSVLTILSQKNPYKFVAIDSLSEINYLCLAAAVEFAVNRGKRHDPEVPEIADYMRNTVRIRKLVRYFRDLEAHVIFSANSTINNGVSMPSLTGKLSGDVMALVDVVGYLGVDLKPGQEDEPANRFLLVSPTPTYSAKDRSEGGKLGTGIVNPTMKIILDLLQY